MLHGAAENETCNETKEWEMETSQKQQQRTNDVVTTVKDQVTKNSNGGELTQFVSS